MGRVIHVRGLRESCNATLLGAAAKADLTSALNMGHFISSCHVADLGHC